MDATRDWGRKVIALAGAIIVFVSVVAALWPPAGNSRLGTSRLNRSSSDTRRRPLLIAFGVVFLGVPVGIVVGWVPVFAVVVLTAGSRWWKTRIERARRAERINDALPETIDLLAVIFGAGGTASQCLDVLVHRGPDAIRPAFAASNQRRAAGTSTVGCLDALADELGAMYRPAIRVLVATERDGAPVATLLERLADESRSVRRRQMEARSRRLPVLLLGPLAACFLPAVLVGTIVPLVFVSIDRLTG